MNFSLSLLASIAPSTTTQIHDAALPSSDRLTDRVSLLAAAFLLAAAVPAFSLHAQAAVGDRVTLLFLAVCASLAGWTPLRKYFERGNGETNAADDGRNAASFALCAAMFLVYSLARRVTPDEGGPALSFQLLPDDKFALSYAALIVLPGALLCGVLSRIAVAQRAKAGGVAVASAWPRAVAAALVLLALLTMGSFQFLSGFYKVGATEVLDPTPMVQVLMQAVEYLALALLCHVATASIAVRRWILVMLPLLLWALWARHQFSAPLPEMEDEE